MGKTYKKTKDMITSLEQYKMGRKTWGVTHPGTRIERPRKGGGYIRKDKYNRQWED